MRVRVRCGPGWATGCRVDAGTLRAAAASSSCTSPTPVAGAAQGTLGNALAAAPTHGGRRREARRVARWRRSRVMAGLPPFLAGGRSAASPSSKERGARRESSITQFASPTLRSKK